MLDVLVGVLDDVVVLFLPVTVHDAFDLTGVVRPPVVDSGGEPDISEILALVGVISRPGNAGGLGLRIRDTLLASGFASRFRAKGRFADLMAALPVRLITHPQPGLFGAAAAFAQEHS